MSTIWQSLAEERRTAGKVLAASLVCFAASARAEQVYLTPEQTPAALFGDGAVGAPGVLSLTDRDDAKLAAAFNGKRIETRRYSYEVVRSPAGALLGAIVFVDVVGQNLPIRFAVGVKPDGTIQDLEVMVYREPHGDEIRDRRFRAQFRGKGAGDPLTVDKDIDAISGATISSHSAAVAAKRAIGLAGLVFEQLGSATAAAPGQLK